MGVPGRSFRVFLRFLFPACRECRRACGAPLVVVVCRAAFCGSGCLPTPRQTFVQVPKDNSVSLVPSAKHPGLQQFLKLLKTLFNTQDVDQAIERMLISLEEMDDSIIDVDVLEVDPPAVLPST